MQQRNCIVIANVANLTGSLNHAIKDPRGGYQKIRVDYKALLDYVCNGRYLLGAYVVSQQDINTPTLSEDRQLANQKFLSKLKNFGWTPIRVSYNSKEQDTTNIVNAIWQNVMAPLVDENRQLTINEALTDVIFINGSALWFDLIQTFFNAGFNPEVSYMKAATSKHLLANFAFDDLTQFFIKNNVNMEQIRG